MSHEVVIRLNSSQYDILKTIGILISKRKGENTINKKININVNSVSIASGRSYKTVQKYLNNLKDL